MATKLFIVQGSMSDMGGLFSLIAETGEVHYDHFCSGRRFAKGDLIGNRPERQREMTEKYGEWEVVYFDEQREITEDELIRRNHELNAVPATPDRILVSCSQGDSDYHEGQPTDNF